MSTTANKVTNPMKVITGPDTRWSYANVWEPKSINGGTPKYSVSLIIPKSGRQDQGGYRGCLPGRPDQTERQRSHRASSRCHQDPSEGW